MFIIKKVVIILFLLHVGFITASGQTTIRYELSLPGSFREEFERERLIEVFHDRVKDAGSLDAWMHTLYERGYLLANYQLEEVGDKKVAVHIEPGPKFSWTNLDQGDLPDELLTRLGYKPGFFDQRIVNFRKISRLFDEVLKYSERHGYPFAIIRLKGLDIAEDALSASLEFIPGPYITFDSLKLVNINKAKPGFLSAYLRIKPGSPYDQRKVDNIPNLINPLPYLSMMEMPATYFANEQCQVLLEMQDEKASAFDGIIGFMPNENEEGRVLVTGQVYLKLENLFRSGKLLELDWRRVNIQSQNLDIAYAHPALFRAPLDLGLSFNLYKQDTTFLTRKTGMDLFYQNYRKSSFGFHFNREVSRLLQVNPLIQNGKPVFADYNLNYYGLVYRYNSLDHPLFPARGWDVILNINAGHKNIIRNTNLDEEFYNGIPDEGLQLQSSGWIAKYFRLRPRNVLLSRVSGGYLHGDPLFLNDLFRLGGLLSIRGFNDMLFYASKYITGTLEYRYLFENESQLLFFCDAAYLGHDQGSQSYRDYPVGLGGGISISTKAGLLNVIYAVGRSNDQTFNIRYSKIHIGYTGRF